jgi:chromate transporter
MKKDVSFYLKLFTSTFIVSAFTFGGGFVIIPLLKKKFVDELNWIEESEMMDLAAIAQSTPGPIAINCSILIGYKLTGIKGALITAFGAALPPLIVISVISMAYEAFKTNTVVKFALRGMQAGIAAVIVDVVISMTRSILSVRKNN